VLLPFAATDPQIQAWVGALLQSLALSGWIIDRNIRIETRYATGNVAEIRRHAAQLVALAPNIIVAHGTSAVSALLQATARRSTLIRTHIIPAPQGRRCRAVPRLRRLRRGKTRAQLERKENSCGRSSHQVPVDLPAARAA
jgi:hypothetical protein